MKKLLFISLLAMLATVIAACSSSENLTGDGEQSASASEYPDKPITFTVPSGAGGGIDTMARVLSNVLSKEELLKTAATVENKPGGGQVVGIVDFANMNKNNDYRILATSTPFILNYIKKDGNSPVSFRDVEPIARLVTEYDVLAVPVDSKYDTLETLFADLKDNPSSISFSGGSGPGSFDHLNAIYPASKAGVDINKLKYISYDGGGEALTALLGGNADVISSDVSSVYEYVKAGKVKILGISSSERLEGEFADIPTYKEQGIDAELTNWRGIYGPKGMSKEAKAFWEATIAELVKTEGWTTEIEKHGWQDGYVASDEFTKLMEEEEAMYTEIYEDLGMAK
ncbi:tripartite tricarboxylate transporter substrate binding protein [Sporosarcina sp. ACRSM]|uniref:Bug family tripartite tricarboxylate transporter substrate binding protein n=1 Tax=Sporosarcina sp. ACRSM TaxID=2918216 RepID=UPI001EF5C9A4|nr:tripartite tricarboxylate transporter substrate-binding protein [Sporosarcina sp. ACRSM]MCG7334733.1 tripartite tricarboxylate transporter substrate binding protein [Sporosarcina sp. ACRSM]